MDRNSGFFWARIRARIADSNLFHLGGSRSVSYSINSYQVSV